ncbi:MAG TPA: ATP-binding protein [Myxococcota bacterium]
MFDVTEQHHREVELQHAQKLSAIGALAAGVAHEINTPVQYVNDNAAFVTRGVARLFDMLRVLLEVAAAASPEARARVDAHRKKIKLEYLTSELPKALDQCADGLTRVAGIVSAMKKFSHTSRGEMAMVQLRESIASTATVARHEWKYAADLDIVIDDDVPPVPALRDELNQVFLNLIVNAAHAIEDKNRGTDRRGRITIRAAVGDDNSVIICVSDDGAGIAPDLKHRVFEPFFTTKPVGKGTGQGLAIAWNVIVKKHGGSIELDSELGRGTSFTIRLPLTRAAMPIARAA